MANLPKLVINLWENREGPVVFTTVDENSTPNSVYVSCIRRENESTFVIADNYFEKTRVNIENGKKSCILFITKNRKSIQMKGIVERHSSGNVFNGMKKWLNPKYPGKAAVVFAVQEVYMGSEKLV